MKTLLRNHQNRSRLRFKVMVEYFDRARLVSLAPPERGENSPKPIVRIEPMNRYDDRDSVSLSSPKGGLELLGKQRKESAGGGGPPRAERAGASESLGWGEEALRAHGETNWMFGVRCWMFDVPRVHGESWGEGLSPHIHGRFEQSKEIKQLSKLSDPSNRAHRAMTLLELLVVLAVLAILAAMILPEMLRAKRTGMPIICVNNLKQTGLACRVWEGDNNDKYPPFVSVTNGGSMEYINTPNVWRHFQVMSNELSTPKVLICPQDTARFFATNFTFMNNSNISFFFGVDASDTNPSMILSGDRNITNGTLVKNSMLELSTNRPSGWTSEMHNKVGNIALADGSVQQVSVAGLRTTVANTGFATNRLQMPALAP